MTDIVERLKTWCHSPDHLAIKDLLDEAAREIERLQRSVTDWQLEADVHRKRAAAAVAEIARLRLTDEERGAVEWSIADQIEGGHQDHLVVKEIIATLRKLLERLK
jgi:hypothetical protein